MGAKWDLSAYLDIAKRGVKGGNGRKGNLHPKVEKVDVTNHFTRHFPLIPFLELKMANHTMVKFPWSSKEKNKAKAPQGQTFISKAGIIPLWPFYILYQPRIFTFLITNIQLGTYFCLGVSYVSGCFCMTLYFKCSSGCFFFPFLFFVYRPQGGAHPPICWDRTAFPPRFYPPLDPGVGFRGLLVPLSPIVSPQKAKKKGPPKLKKKNLH